MSSCPASTHLEETLVLMMVLVVLAVGAFVACLARGHVANSPVVILVVVVRFRVLIRLVHKSGVAWVALVVWVPLIRRTMWRRLSPLELSRWLLVMPVVRSPVR